MDEEIIYNNCHFRNRLEAQWAAFFDLRGWKWEYMPFINFKGWSPDFAIYGQSVVYVKIQQTFCFPGGNIEFEKEIIDSRCDEEVLIVGTYCFLPGNQDYRPDEEICLGWLRNHDYENEDNENDGHGWDLVVHCKCGFHPCLGSWNDRISGEYNNRGSLDERSEYIKLLWKMAKIFIEHSYFLKKEKRESIYRYLREI